MSMSKKLKREMHFRSCDRAHDAAEHYINQDVDHTTAVVMLITDIMHMCAEQSINFDAVLTRARANYEGEKTS